MSIEQARAFLEEWLVHNIHNAVHPENEATAKHLAQRCLEAAQAHGLTKADLEAAAGEDLVTCVMDAQDATADAKMSDLIEGGD